MDHRERSRPMKPYRSALVALVFLAAIVAIISLVFLNWNETSSAVGLIQIRLFLAGWAAAALAIVIAGLLLRSGRASLLRPPLETLYHLLMGLELGLMVGTTPWEEGVRLAGWTQFWLTIPIFTGYVFTLFDLWQERRTSA
ncbi:hypothetical protein [Rubrobacter naiadicus]|uniref:hypothetical protein n=1 Tax=Rubrobacter naiadicus TaxID=1392641 RepID=UPI002361C775|nr:hypothetical protein [Rubrobacter naiadicus]